jgi:hypothetical protein
MSGQGAVRPSGLPMQQRNPDTDHSQMLLIAGIGIFHLQEGGAWQLGALTAILESFLVDRAVVQRADLCGHHFFGPEGGAFDHVASGTGLVEEFALVAFKSAGG